MHRLAALLIFSTMIGCTAVDVGVGRGDHSWSWDNNGTAYATYGWPANDALLSADLLGGQNDGTLASLDVWRLLHLELGLLGFGIGIGPLQFGAGFGWHDTSPPASIDGDNPFGD